MPRFLRQMAYEGERHQYRSPASRIALYTALMHLLDRARSL